MIKDIKELIEMKEQVEKRKNQVKTVYIKSLDTEFKVKLATRPEMVDILKMDAVDQDPYNIYMHVVEPNLKDKELQNAYNKGHQPHEIVDKLLEPVEVGMLSNVIAGNENAKNMVKDLKN